MKKKLFNGCLVLMLISSSLLLGCGKSDKFKENEKGFEKLYSQLIALKDEDRNAFESCYTFDPFKRKAKTVMNGYKRYVGNLNNIVKENPDDRKYLDELQDKISKGNAIVKEIEGTISFHTIGNGCYFN